MTHLEDYEIPSSISIREAHNELLAAEKRATASKWVRRGLGAVAATAIFGIGHAEHQEPIILNLDPMNIAAGGALMAGVAGGIKKKEEAARYGDVAASIAPSGTEATYKVH